MSTTTDDRTPEDVPGGSSEPPDPQTGEADDTDETTEAEPETFPREYVVQLRQEAADARVKAKRTDELAQRLHGALVAATGRLADPTDLPYHETHLDEPDALTAAIDELLTRKSHLASRRPVGDIGQGATASADVVDLAELLRGRAK